MKVLERVPESFIRSQVDINDWDSTADALYIL